MQRPLVTAKAGPALTPREDIPDVPEWHRWELMIGKSLGHVFGKPLVMHLPLRNSPGGNPRAHPARNCAPKFHLHLGMLCFAGAALIFFKDVQKSVCVCPIRAASASRHAMVGVCPRGAFSMSSDRSLQEGVCHVNAAFPTLKVLVMHGLLNEMLQVVSRVCGLGKQERIDFVELLI